MTEALLALGLAVSALAGLSGLLKDEWDHTRCAVIAFETGHRALLGEAPRTGLLAVLGSRPILRLSESASTVVAEARCGRASERVEFVRLEAARW